MANNTKTATPKTQEPKAEAATANRKPIHEIRMGRIKAAIWQNETDNGIRYNVTVGRLYKDGESTGSRPKASAAMTCRFWPKSPIRLTPSSSRSSKSQSNAHPRPPGFGRAAV